MHGQFLLVQLETPDEAVLGRITSLSSEGRLSSESGEEFNIRAVRDERPVPDGLREDYLKYRVNIRVLGVIRKGIGGGLTFVPSHRRLPHVGSPVAFPSPEVLREIGGHNISGADIGFLALGEYIYSAMDDRLMREPWMQVKEPAVIVKFPVDKLVSRRSFIFARAGFGKSNLNKLLFSELYRRTPTVEKRGGRAVPVGTIVFDPEGEYFWPDDRDRPGLADVPHLQDQLVVFTPRAAPSSFYSSFVAGDIRLDIRRLRPGDVISIALSPEKQDQQNIRKLKSLNPSDWSDLVDLIHQDGNSADLSAISRIIGLQQGQQDVEALAARANMTSIVRMLHDPSSQMMDMLLKALADGKLCVVDVSRLRGGASLILSGLILRKIFDHNQDEFTKSDSRTIPTIAVVEEAQSVLNEAASGSTPYVEWVKEGRKYDLGAVLVTQQPGSISTDILSQGDNWFIFHLLSAADLQNVRKANAHFSEDILSSLLNEPIAGQGVFWSSVGGRPYPIPLRVLSFESAYKRLDRDYNRPAVDSYTSRLRTKFATILRRAIAGATRTGAPPEGGCDGQPDAHHGSADNDDQAVVVDDNSAQATQAVDTLQAYKQQAIHGIAVDPRFRDRLLAGKLSWGRAKYLIIELLPETMSDREGVAYALVPDAVSAVLGKRDLNWTTERRQSPDGKSQTYFVRTHPN